MANSSRTPEAQAKFLAYSELSLTDLHAQHASQGEAVKAIRADQQLLHDVITQKEHLIERAKAGPEHLAQTLNGKGIFGQMKALLGIGKLTAAEKAELKKSLDDNPNEDK